MAYIGREPTNTGEFLLIDDISSNFNGSEVNFTLQVGLLDITPAAANTVIALDGVLQEPTTAYSISGSTITFTEAPDTGLSFYGVLAGQSQYIANSSITNEHISAATSISGSKINTDFGAQNIQITHITASGNISASGIVIADTFQSTGGDIDGISFTDDLNITGNITASGNISASGIFTAEGLVVSDDANITDNLTVGGDLDISDTIYHTGDSNTKIRFPEVDTISFHTSGNERMRISAGGHITASGAVSASGTITANQYGGNISGSVTSTGSFGKIVVGNDIDLVEDQRIHFEADKTTYIESHASDTLRAVVNNRQMFLLDEDTGNRAVFGNGTKVFVGSNNNRIPTASLHIGGDIWASGSNGNVTASGNISSSASIIGNTFTGTFNGALSSSAQIAASISGSRDAASISGSRDAASISGSRDAVSISGSLGANAGVIRTLSAATVSGSFGNQRVGTTDDVKFANITGSNNISASGNLSITGNVDVDGTSNFAGNVTLQNDLTVTGRIDAEEIHTTFISSSIAQATGSNIFGDSISDLHQFTGSIDVSGSGTVLKVSDGNVDFDGDLDVDGTSNLDIVDIDGAVNMAQDLTMGANILMADDTSIGISDSAERIEFDGAGDISFLGATIGIGTTSPQSELHVSGSGEVQVFIDAQGGNNGGIRLLEGGANKWTIANDQSNDSLFFYTFEGSAKRFVLDNNSRISLGNNDSGDNNTVFGYQAGDDIASGGNYNTIYGYNAATKLTTGDASVFIGQGAGQVHVTGNRNIAIGHNAMVDTDAGSTSYASNDNLFIGVDAGGGTWTNTAIQQNIGIGNYSMDSALDEAQENTAVGYGSLSSITTADRNTAIGYNAATALTTGANNVIVGDAAGDAIIGASGSVFLGYNAGGTVTYGSDNIAIGNDAMNGGTVTTGTRNIAIGLSAGDAITTGYEHIAIGKDAGGAFTTGNNNVAIGTHALRQCTEGSVMVAIGGYALDSVTSSTAVNKTVAIGYYALQSLTVGENNTALGYQALTANSAGDQNTAVGNDAMMTYNPADGDGHNTAVGHNALKALTTGVDNTVVGSTAGDAANTASGSTLVGMAAGGTMTSGNANTFVGYNAGANDATMTGDANVAIGYNTAKTMTSAAHNVFIGDNAATAHTTGLNNVIIGQKAAQSNTGLDNCTIIGRNTSGNNGASFEFIYGSGVGGLGGNSMTIGKDSTNRIYNVFTSNATWTRSSDKRIKKDINTNIDIGLDFIKDLRTVNFKWKAPSEIPQEITDLSGKVHELDAYNESKTEHDHPDKIYGFIAQEVKETLDNHNIKGFSGWHEGIDGVQGVSYEMFVVPLVKAIQELSEKIEHIEKTCKCIKEN